jgi:hypothetical protein
LGWERVWVHEERYQKKNQTTGKKEKKKRERKSWPKLVFVESKFYVVKVVFFYAHRLDTDTGQKKSCLELGLREWKRCVLVGQRRNKRDTNKTKQKKVLRQSIPHICALFFRERMREEEIEYANFLHKKIYETYKPSLVMRNARKREKKGRKKGKGKGMGTKKSMHKPSMQKKNRRNRKKERQNRIGKNIPSVICPLFLS